MQSMPEVTGNSLDKLGAGGLQVTEKTRLKRAAVAIVFGLLSLLGLLLSSGPQRVEAATSSNINFQMRLLTSSGAVVSDGNYHLEFKLYNAANSTGSSQGSCAGDASCLWTETRTTGNLVRVVNGYFNVRLGSVTALPSIDWNQELWLGVRVGGSAGTASWETVELTSDGTATGNKIALTAVPYAFSANKLQATSGTITNTLTFATPSGSNKTLTLPNETGTVCTTGSICTGYQAASASTLQNAYNTDVDGSDVVIQLAAADDSLIFRNPSSGGTDSAYVLTIDQLATGAVGGLSIESAGTGALFKVRDTTATAQDVMTIADGGATTFRNQNNSTTAFQVQNAAGNQLLGVDTSNGGNVSLLANNSAQLTTFASVGSTLPGGTVKAYHGNILANGYMYQIGGGDGSICYSSVHYTPVKGDGTLGSWTATSSLPATRGGHSTVYANGYIYVMGGDPCGTVQTTVYYAKQNADGTLGVWQTSPNGLSVAIGSAMHSVTHYRGYIYIAGGLNTSSASISTVQYAKVNADGSTGPWLTTTALPSERAHASVVSANGFLYVIGGYRTQTPGRNSTVYYAPINLDGSLGSWTNSANNLSALASPNDLLEQGVPYIMNGYIYVTGGSNTTEQATADTLYAQLNTGGSTGAWAVLDNHMNGNNRYAAGYAVGNGYVYVLGGRDNATTYQNTVYYASSPRVRIGGSLDLVGLANQYLLGGGDVNQGSVGGSLTAGNTKVVGSLEVQGQSSFAQGVGVGGNLTVGGSALFQNANNLDKAFQIQTAVGNSVINVSTITLENLITNSSFESNSTGWARLQGAETTFATATSGTKDGSQSLQVTTDGVTANQGARYTYFFKPNTTYNFSIYASVSSGSIATFDLGTNINGTTTTCLSAQTVTTTVTRYSCSFTTGATTTGSDYVFARRSTAAIVTIYLDAAQLELGATASTYRPDVYPNLIANPSAETSANGWAVKGSATSVAVSEEFSYFGSRSIKLVTGTAANNGAAYSYPLTASTRYSLSVWLRRDTSSTATINIGRQDVSGTDVDCLTGQTVDTTWKQFICTFTTGATITAPTTLYVKQTDLVTDNIYIDGLTLVASGAAQSFSSPSLSIQAEPLYGSITLNGANTGELGPWNTTNTLPAVRDQLESVVANGYIYAIGGETAQTSVYYAKLNTDGTTGAWSTNTNSLPVGRGHFSLVTANGYVYVIGGSNGSFLSSIHYAKLNSDGSTGAWQTNANPLPDLRARHSSVVANGYVYVMGGTNGGPAASTVYYAKLNADGSTGPWQTSANAMPAGEWRHSSVVANGYVYVIGGDGNNRVYYARLNADGSTGTWTNQATNLLPSDRLGHSSVVANGYVYVIGGNDGTNRLASVHYARLNSDGSTGAWSTNANALPDVRYTHATAMANGFIYVIGGENASAEQNTVLYASTSRILVGGSLDLVGLGGQNLADGGDFSQGSTGGSLTAGNTKVVGSLEVQGQSSFAQGLSVDKDLRVGGSALFQNANNSDKAFQIQTAIGASVMNVSTITLENLITNSSFESNSTGWAKLQGAETTFATATSGLKDGSQSLQVTTDGVTANQGARYTYFFKPNTTYNFSIYASVSSGSIATFDLGTNINGTTTTCLSAQTVTTTVTRFNCSFTTGATTTGSDYIFARRSTAAIVTIYLDAAQLEPGATASTYRPDVYPNLIANPSAETSANGWAIKGSATSVAVSEEFAYFGSRSVKLATGTAANNGAAYSYPLTASSRYSLSVWLRRDTSSTATINIGRQDVSGTDVDCLTGQTADTTWRQFTCTFTTGATITAPTTLYVKQTDLVTDNIYIDGLSLVASGAAQSYSSPSLSIQAEPLYGSITLNGANTGELGTWATNSNGLPAGRFQHSSVVANGYLYAIGGSGGSAESTVYYAKLNTDGSTGTWATNTNALPGAREGHSTVFANGYIYVIGGWSGAADQSTVYYAKVNADGSTGAWSTANALPAVRVYHTSVSINGYIYVIGGSVGGIDGTNQSTVYYAKQNADGSVGAWSTNSYAIGCVTQGCGSPVPRTAHSSIVASGYLYVIGGYNSGTAQSTVYYAKVNADGSTGAWSTNANALPAARFHLRSVVANGYVYVLGGNNGGGQSTVYYAKLTADGSTGAWSTNANALPAIRSEHTAVIANGYVYVIGGCCFHTTVYYASTSRILVGGSLDLVGLAGQNLADGGDFSQGSTGGSLTAGNTKVVGTLEVQGQSSFAQGIAVNGNGAFNGDVSLGVQTNNTPHTFTSTCGCALNSAAGTFITTTDAGIDSISDSIVYKGKLFVAVNELNAAAVYRYDGGTSWTRVTFTTRGEIASDGLDATDIDAIVMAVFNGKLYLGSQTGASTGALYVSTTADTTANTFTLVNATRGTFATAGMDGVSDLAVWNGGLYIATQESAALEIVRYDGGTTFTQVSGADGNPDGGGIGIDGAVFAVYEGRLFAGLHSGSGANAGRVAFYAGTGTTWTGTTSGSLGPDINIDDIASLEVWNGSLYAGTRETDGAAVYRWTGSVSTTTMSSSDWRLVSTGAGEINSGDTANTVDNIVLKSYNGRLYAGSSTNTTAITTNSGAVYEYDATTNAWTVLNGTRGTFAGQTGVNNVVSLTEYNRTLIVSTDDVSDTASVFTWNKINDTSYSLLFSSTAGNTAGISFVGNVQTSNFNQGNTGSFAFTHGIMSTSGSYDVAEDYPTRDSSLQPGDLVSIDPYEAGFVRRTLAKSDSTVVGIYSEKPGLRLSQTDPNKIDGAEAVPVALAGRVPVKVTDENGPILPGDYLTSSSTPGVAMKAASAGPTIGKALQSFSGSSGKIEVFVNVSYALPNVNLQGSDYIFMDYLRVNSLANIESLEVAGTATFQGLIVLGKHLIGNPDTAGSLTILAGQSVVTYTFINPYANPPKVILSPNGDTTGIRYWTTKMTTGFTIRLSAPATANLEFDYHVQGVQ